MMALGGCATTQFSGYIKADHPYVRKISGDYNKIIDAIKVVLFKENWEIQAQVNPSVYERSPDGEDQSKDILFITKPRRYFNILYFTYEHLNIFVHAIAEGAQVDIRFQAVSPMTTGTRNQALANRLLDKIKRELESK